MSRQEMLKQALQLDPASRFELAEDILHSLDQPDPAIDSVWIEEAKRRLDAWRVGKVKGIPAEDIFGAL
ncbi:MAG TPA: addiction module protein [Rhodanobacteraceae bacterium]|nr:addiction module protein [Rhodanobacteraceae bacterium]